MKKFFVFSWDVILKIDTKKSQSDNSTAVFLIKTSLTQIHHSVSGAQPKIFQSKGGFVKLGHFDKHLVKKSRKKGLAGKFFLLDTLKTTFWIVHLTYGWTQSGSFFLKLGHFF